MTEKNEPRLNRQIQIWGGEVRFIDEEGTDRGIFNLAEALRIAFDAGLDLVEIAPKARPPVVRAMDYKKYKFLLKKKQAEIEKKNKPIELKEVKLRPNTDPNDLNTKTNQIIEFLKKGHKVSVTVMFKGREVMHHHLGKQKLDLIAAAVTTANVGTLDQAPVLQGKNYNLQLMPV